MLLNNIGIAGEVRYVVTAPNGKVKADTGYQSNLILNQGLDFFGGGRGGAINFSCAVGGGNSSPSVTQTTLDSFIAISIGGEVTSSYAYIDKGDGMYRMWEQKKYRFTGLNNVNISEVGLVSSGSSSSDYYLTTRTLIKDQTGNPTTISIKSGETLDIYYKIHKVIDTRDKVFLINILDGNGGMIPYNATLRPLSVGSNKNKVTSAATEYRFLTVNTTGLLPIITATSSGDTVDGKFSFSGYSQGSFKITANLFFSLNEANIGIRRLDSYSAEYSGILPFQIQFDRVSDNAPLTKTANQTLSIPLEFSWGRYEGAL